MKSKTVRGWHFSTGRNANGDGRQLVVGRWQTMRPANGHESPVLCKSGMHASPRARDALHYAPGSVVALVDVRGDIQCGGDKFCGRQRRVIAMSDADVVLRRFAIWCAARAMRRAQVTDVQSWSALRVASRFCCGRATKEELAAARDAARDAAWDVAWDVAWDAARAAARAAAWDAARDAARDEQNAELTRRLCALLGVDESEASA